jgi:hypothetical protein
MAEKLQESKDYVKVASLRLWHNYEVFNPYKYYGNAIGRWSKMQVKQFDSTKPLFSDPIDVYSD